jgi:hypothetical protein
MVTGNRITYYSGSFPSGQGVFFMLNQRYLEIIASFCNTRDERQRFDGDVGLDHLETCDQLKEWLVTHQLLLGDDEVKHEDLQLARKLRNGLRLVIDPMHPNDVKGAAILNEVAQHCPLSVRFDKQAVASLDPIHGGVREALGRLLIKILEAQQTDNWSRLKMCSASDCRWVFVDYSRPGTGKWCSMKACGNRAKKRAFRNRQKSGNDRQMAGK